MSKTFLQSAITFFLAGLVSACSTLPDLKQSSADSKEYGYWADKPSNPSVPFDVYARLPAKEEYKFVRRFIVIGAAKVCNDAKLPYFDISDLVVERVEGNVQISKALGICCKDPQIPLLQITFAKTVKLLEDGPAPVVENTNNKTNTKFAVGDLLLTFDGVRISTNYLMRKVVTLASRNGKKSVSVEVMRNGEKIKFDEPILMVKNDWSAARVAALNNIYRM